ncbi:MAG: hypothetical protein ACRYFK_14265 [Janthinobacterium lividum]
MAKPDRKPDPDFEPDYDVADTEHDEGSQASYDEGADPDFEESAQADYDADFSDADALEASQEWRHRPQK